ncbi:MAG: nucleoid-associated protein [Clostridiaceae bacterium]
MEYISDVSIQDAIIHILDNEAEEPILNEYPLVLGEELYEFIYKHLIKSLKDEELKYGIFNEGMGLVKDVSEAFFNKEIDFIFTSKELALRLFAVMKAAGNIPSCDLLIVSFLTEFGPMIGILKMDYIKNYAHTVDFIDDKIGIRIIEQYTGLPSSGQRLQKCAFIKERKETSDLLVIDKINKNKDDHNSNFFVGNYLDCMVVDNPRDYTKNFIKAAETWTQKALSDNAEEQEFVRSNLKRKLKEEEVIDVKSIAEDIFKDNDEAKESFTQYVMESSRISQEVPMDKEYVEKKLKRVRLKIDKDIDLYLNEEIYSDGMRFEVVRNGDGTINMIIKNVRNYVEK